MQRIKRPRFLACLLGLWLGPAWSAGARAGLIEFDAPGLPTGINDSGLIVGTSGGPFSSNFSPDPFLFEPGANILPSAGSVGYYGTVGNFTTLSVPGASGTAIGGVNNTGEIVGTYLTGSGPTSTLHGFTYQNGTFTSIDFAGAASTAIQGVNNLGQLVGNYTTAQGSFGFVGTNGNFATIPAAPAAGPNFNSNGQYTGFTPGFDNPVFYRGINDAGTVVGSAKYRTGSGGPIYTVGFREENGTYQPFRIAFSTSASGINTAGIIAGTYSSTATDSSFGYLQDPGGSYTTISVAGSSGFGDFYSTFVTGLNNTGSVVGFDEKSGRSFVLSGVSAVPEPSTLTMAGPAGLTVLAGAVRRKRGAARAA